MISRRGAPAKAPVWIGIVYDMRERWASYRLMPVIVAINRYVNKLTELQALTIGGQQCQDDDDGYERG